MSAKLSCEASTHSPMLGSDTPLTTPEPTRVAFLTNFIPPYWKPVLRHLSLKFPNLRVLLSTAMEADRTWKVDWQGLDVVLQRTITLETNASNPLGFEERRYTHLPIDTVIQLGRFKAEVVISAELGFRTLMAVIYRRLHRRSRLIVYADLSERTERARGGVRALLRTFISKNADSFVVLGESGANYVRGLGVPDENIHKVPYATDVSRFRNNSATRGSELAHRLLYVGRLVERKGLLQFIRSLSEWLATAPHYRAELVLAGDGPLRETLERLAVPAGLRLTLLGDKDYHDMPGIYAQAGILVFPSFADTWGLVVNEAMASGLPVLGSIYSQAVEELVRDGWNGWIFRPDHPDEMFQAIHRSMTVPIAVLDQMRERARSTGLRLTSEDMAQRIANVVDCALMPRRKF